MLTSRLDANFSLMTSARSIIFSFRCFCFVDSCFPRTAFFFFWTPLSPRKPKTATFCRWEGEVGRLTLSSIGGVTARFAARLLGFWTFDLPIAFVRFGAW
jgi:hypothetical protein